MINSSNLFMKRKYRVVIGKEIVDKNKKIDEQNCKNKGACLPCFDDEKDVTMPVLRFLPITWQIIYRYYSYIFKNNVLEMSENSSYNGTIRKGGLITS